MKFKKTLGTILVTYGTFGIGTCLIDIYQKGTLMDFKICGVAIIGFLLFFVGLTFFKTVKKRAFFDNTKHRLSSNA